MTRPSLFKGLQRAGHFRSMSPAIFSENFHVECDKTLKTAASSTLCSTIICCTRIWTSQHMTGRPSTSSSQSGLSSITSWWVGEAGHMLLGVLDINGALVSLTSLPSLWLRLHDEQTIRPVVVVPVSIHGDTISRDEFVCDLKISIKFIKILANIKI